MYKKKKKFTPTEKQVLEYVVYLLSRRDYSKKEILDKCSEKYDDEKGVVNKVISDLVEKDYISDTRFIESYVYWKYSQGYGRTKIKIELNLKGVGSMTSLIEEEFNKHDWFESAKSLKNSKYGDSEPSDYKELQKRKNFFLRRGFSFDEVNYAFEKDESD